MRYTAIKLKPKPFNASTLNGNAGKIIFCQPKPVNSAVNKAKK